MGLVCDLTWGIESSDVAKSIELLAASGAKWARLNLNWSDIEPERTGAEDSARLHATDQAIRTLHAAGIDVLMPFADGVPFWASADPAKAAPEGSQRTWDKLWRPLRFDDYADFVGRMVERYRDLGVDAFEVWNEPNFVRFWPSGPDPADYAGMLEAASAAVRVASPSARVVLGGLSTNDFHFLDALYQLGAAASFDVVAVHPYTGDADPELCWSDDGEGGRSQHALCGIESVRDVMVRHGDEAKPVWVTEIGWSTAAAAPGVSERLQAEYLKKAFRKLERYPYVEVALWYALRNAHWAGDDPGDVEANYGLVRTDFSPKPAYDEFRRVARRRRRAPARAL